MTNYQRTYSIGEVEVEGSAIYHKTEYRERRDHYTLFGCTRKVDGYDTSRDAFVGVHHGLHDPQAVLAGGCTNSHAHGWNPIGAHQINLTLKPGAEETFAFVLAYVEQGSLPKFDAPFVMNKSKGRAILARYADLGTIDAAFAALRARWDELLSFYQAPKVPNEHLRRMVNVWNQYQVMATFNLSRSTSGYETGIGRGMGYRDSNQDLLGFVHLDPRRSRQRLLDIASTQLADGTCYHQYQPLTKKGNADIGGGFNDDPLWLILATCAYIRETGDATILDEPCGYADKPGSRDTLHDHLEISIAYTLNNRGPHGLPLIGHADWNDCLNLNCFSKEPNESFQVTGDIAGSPAESVMIAGLFLYAARDLAALYRWLGRTDDAQRLDRAYADMLQTVETQAWDGEWYTRAFDAQGRPGGSKACEEGKIFIESQGCVVRPRWRRPDERPRPEGARGGRPAPLPDRSRLCAPVSAVFDLPSRARRGLQLSAGLQGKRRGLLPQQHLDSHWLDDVRRGRESPRLLPEHLPVGQEGPRRLPLRALCLCPDDREPSFAHPRRGQEFLAHRHRRVGAGRGPAIHPRRAPRF